MMQVQHVVERRKQMREEHESPLQQRQTLLMRTEVSVKKLCEAPPVLLGLRVCMVNNALLIWL